MDSPQSVVSPFKSSIIAEPENQRSDIFLRTSSCLSKGIEITSKEPGLCNLEKFIGVLEIFIHQARDIQNICIYQKQDVYAKLCLTSNPENTVSTRIINGGGRNPVFNENLSLSVLNVDSSLKCEIWMLSRVRNYLEDQLLGFALVPLSEILIKNGKLEKEFSLSSTDLFHSPSGFVQLSLSYTGSSPEVMAIPSRPVVQDLEIAESLPSDLDKIEFPDPKIVNENELMVSEYFGIPSSNLDSQSSESLEETTDAEEDQLSSEIGVHDHVVESFSKLDSPPSSVSTNGVSSPSESSDAPKTPNQEQATKSTNYQKHVSAPKEKKNSGDVGDGESGSSGEVLQNNVSDKPVVSVNIEPEQKMVQQDIVDMYMKSMQQFTESLAKMKLPLDIENGPASSGDSSSDQKFPASKNSRVFYGSRAFF